MNTAENRPFAPRAGGGWSSTIRLCAWYALTTWQ